jgi:hypothetical protein
MDTNLAGNGLEKGVNNPLRESSLLILIHFDNLPPVCGDLGKMETLREINQVKDILLEAASTETNRCFQEFGTNTGIVTDSIRNFIDVGTSGFANSGKGVDGRDTLCKHSVGGEFG